MLPADRMLDVRYEDVVADLEEQARRMLAHCGLAWDPACLECGSYSLADFRAQLFEDRLRITFIPATCRLIY
jgi:hypothetical protein